MKSFRFSGRAAVVCSLILAIGIPSAAMGFGEGRNLLLGKRNPSSNPSKALTSETEIIANSSTYGTRQSNKKDGDGGGAIYGCRSSVGKEPCIRANNLKDGRAFEFVTNGKEAGRIEVGGDHTGAPLTTNATGVATGLNADKVDGKDGADLAAASDLLFALVTDATATTPASVTGRGATKVVKTAATATDNDFTVTFNRDVSKCSSTVSPVGDPIATVPSVAPMPGDATSIRVRLGETSRSFHLQVIC